MRPIKIGYWEIHNKILNGKRTIGQALKYLDDNYTGQTRTAIRHQMEVTSHETTIELQLRGHLKDAIQLGYRNDTDFERVFR